MAIYHFSAQVISRGKGQSAVASAAYRSGDKLTDERTGEVKQYVRDVQPDTMILAPTNTPNWVYDRERLWNEVELAERRKDAQLAREINIALPKELNAAEQKELIQDYIQKEFVDKGMIADLAIHRDDPNNPHAHVMLTTRTISLDGFGQKDRNWNNRALLEQWREQWATHANNRLEKAGIGDRISHLSNEDRGLVQLPTVHLGHVASEMEKRGAKTERGDLNRERQEYNKTVADLQKYREEKQALEQEIARKEKSEKSKAVYYTPGELNVLQAAKTYLKATPTIQAISNRREQLDSWEKRVENNTQFMSWKDKTIKEASELYETIHRAEETIKRAEQRIDDISWINPLKLKENRITKERLGHDIARAKEVVKDCHKRLEYHTEKLKFNSEEAFNQVQETHAAERPKFLDENFKLRRVINTERDTLDKAEKALQNGFVRKLASYYPDRPEMEYLSYDKAKELAKLSKLNGSYLDIEDMKAYSSQSKQEIQRVEKEISRISDKKGSLERANHYLSEYKKQQDTVNKYENSLVLKGKIIVSKSAKEEYENAIAKRDNLEQLLRKEGISDQGDYQKQMDVVTRMESKVPDYQGRIQQQQLKTDVLDGILFGIEQAAREMGRQQKQQEKQKGKGKGKRRSQDLELGM